ncbi:hypothetical protein BSLG_007650 [Batrachochytrium salamandrivorans]|nr:hypothetical protein BSLG_007650 [Batrachochytrium salamandrivorans]
MSGIGFKYRLDRTFIWLATGHVLAAEVFTDKDGFPDGPHYFVHYRGWKASWDEWVPPSRVLKNDADGLQRQAELRFSQATKKGNPKGILKPSPTSATDPAAGSHIKKRRRDSTADKEELFLRRPEIRISIPEPLKVQLVEDWEMITKSLKLVPLPREVTVSDVLDQFIEAIRMTIKPKGGRVRMDQDAVNILKDHFVQVLAYLQKNQSELFLKEYEAATPKAAIEERYATDLARLSKRTFSDKIDPDYIGTLGLLWAEILNTTAMVATTRSALAADFSKLEQAFKSRCDKDQDPEWSKVKHSLGTLSTNYENDFVKLTKEYADKISRFEKLDAKSKKSTTGQTDKKLQDMTSVLESAKIQWETEAIRLFEKFEQMDRNRLEFIKSSLLRYAQQEVLVGETTAGVRPHTSQPASIYHPDLNMGSLGSISVASGIQHIAELFRENTPAVDADGFSIRPEITDPFKLNPVASDSPENVNDSDSGTRGRTQSSYGGSVMVPNLNGAVALSTLPETTPARALFSVHETLNVLQVDGLVDKILITGEINAQLLEPASGHTEDNKICRLHIRHSDTLLHIVPNEEYISVSLSDPDAFDLNLTLLNQKVSNTVPLFKYQVLVNDPAQFSPIYVKPMWKCEEKQASLLVTYELNTELLKRLPAQDLTILASIQGGGDISTVQTKPTGAWDLDVRSIMWQLAEPEWGSIHEQYVFY